MKSQSSLNNKHINKSIFGGDSMYFAVPDYWRLYCYHLYKNIKYYCSVFLLLKLSTGDSYESAFLRKVNPYLDQNCKNTYKYRHKINFDWKLAGIDMSPSTQ